VAIIAVAIIAMAIIAVAIIVVAIIAVAIIVPGRQRQTRRVSSAVGDRVGPDSAATAARASKNVFGEDSA